MGRPTPAERARTLSHGVAGGVLVTPDWPYDPVAAHAADETGRPLLLMPTGSPAVLALADAADLPATLRISDLAPVAFADRVRGRAWLHGRLTAVPAEELRTAALRLARLHPWPELLDLAAPPPGTRPEWTLLALEVGEVEVQDVWGTVTVRPAEYAAAAPDPFAAVEAGMLTHLDACHGAELTALFRERIAPHVAAPAVRPLGLDRYGLSLRCFPGPCEAHGNSAPPSFDLRVEFTEPVSDVQGLRRVYRELFSLRAPR